MWSCRALLAISIATCASATTTAWKPGAVYKYRAEARTLTAVHQVDDVYAGILIKGDLELRPTSKNVLIAKLVQPKYAPIQARLPGGWNSHLPERHLTMKPLPVSGKPFEIRLEDGLVVGMVVSNNVPLWEINILKSVASQLQVNTEGKELIPGGLNTKPNHTAPSPNAVFRAMEDSITGKCEVLYDIAQLPPYIAMAQPHLAPQVKSIADTPLIEVVKTQNYSNCDKRIAFNFGFPGNSEFQHPDGNQANEFLARSSVSRIIISGSLHRYTIQSSVTTSKVIVSPLLYNKQKAMVVSSLNLTLASLKSASGHPQPVTDRKIINDLGYSYENVYNYKPAFDRTQSDASSSSLSSKASGSSSASSSQESYGQGVSRSSARQGADSSIHRSNEEENRSVSGSTRSIWRFNNQNSEDESQASISASKTQSRLYSGSQEENQEKPYYGGMRLKRAIYKKGRYSRDSLFVSSEEDREDKSSSILASGEPSNRESSQENSTSEMESSSEFRNESSKENIYLPLPPITEPLSLPMLPLFAGISGKPLSQKINVAEYVRKMSLEIASDARTASFMEKQKILAKFSILTDVIRTMSTKQLQAATSSLYTSQSSSSASESQNMRIFAWRVFRDAVAEAGTSPALMVMKDWILNSKVEGDEAAWLIAVLPSSAMMPTAKYIHELFKLVFSPKVSQQLHLNVTALLTFTNLVRMSQIDNSTVHKYYPVHAYGRPAPRSDVTWQEVYIPQLKKRLEEAVSQNDSVKIQAYTSAIGSIGHPLILKVFEPYLERRTYITTFQRTFMVASMSHLAKLYPEVARQVLFKIYQNAAESHELRCAAVLLLFSTNPPRAMLQRMAEFTNYDTHTQVNAAVKSGLQSLGNLKGSAYRELALAAKSAVNMLNATQYSKQFSSNNIHSYESEKYALSYTQVVNYIGSDDTIIPKSLYFNVTRNLGGFKHGHLSFAAMTSSVPDLLELLKAQIGNDKEEYESGNESEDESSQSSPLEWETKFTPRHISKLLGLKLNESDPVEGNIMLKITSLSRFFAFDSRSIEKLPQVWQEVMVALSSERSFNFTKFFNQYRATLAFPVTTGLPLVYTLKTPSVISIGGKARVRTQLDEQSSSLKAVNASGQLDIWYSSTLQAELGFITPFDNEHYISGVTQDLFINLPARAKVDVDVKNNNLKLTAEPLHQEQKSTVLYYSTVPFIVRHNILSLKPLQEESNYELIVNNDFTQLDSTFGEKSTGMSFRAHYNTSGTASILPSKLEELKRDPLMLLYFPRAEESIKYENFTFSYIPERSSSSSVVVRLAYASVNNSSTFEELSSSEERSFSHSKHKKSKSSLYSPTSSNSQRRIGEFLERVSSGIKNSSAMAIDLSVQFPGENSAEFVTTAAWARSPVDELSRVAASVYQKPASEVEQPLQMCFDMSSKIPYVPLLNYKDALKAAPYISADAVMNIGETCSAGSRITAQVKFSQSKEWKTYVSQHPMAQLCESQMNEGNNALPACRNVTAEANYMDQMDFHIKYNSLPVSLKNLTYKSYSALLSSLYPYVDENVFVERPIQNQINLKWKIYPNLKEWNVWLESPIVTAKLEHLPLGPLSWQLLAVHPVYSPAERLSRVFLGDQYNAKCTIGNSAVNTFDNNTYPVFMGKCWHAMLKLAPRPRHDSDFMYVDKYSDVAVLVRDSGSLKKDVKLITGEDVIDLTPSSSHQDEGRGYASGKVRVNGVTLRVASNNVTYIYKDHGAVWVEIFNLPSGEISLRYPIHGLWVLYDGQTIQLSANDSYRGSSRGLCGTFDGELITDFTAPSGSYLNDTQLFAASYSLPEDCQGPVASIRRKAILQGAVRPRNDKIIPFNIIDDDDIWGGLSSSSSSSSSSRQSGQDSSATNEDTSDTPVSPVFRTKVVVDGSQICFSLHPLPICTPGSHAASHISKSIPVYCINSNNPTAKKLRAMVENGANPDLRRKGASKYLKVGLPKVCKRD